MQTETTEKVSAGANPRRAGRHRAAERTRRPAHRRDDRRRPPAYEGNPLRQFMSFGMNVRMLLVYEFAIGAGFFMLMPYLAVHLTDTLAFGGLAVGFVLGLRNFGQQGMFLLGGTITDRFGYKIPMVVGCALRAAGFVTMGIVDSLPALMLASLLAGLAGALFMPAVRVGIADAAGPRRLEAFALCISANRLGLLAGPLAGLALTGINFTVTCVASGLVFTLLAVLQHRTLPTGKPDVSRDERVTANIAEVANNRRLVSFAVSMIGSYVLSFQIYLALPMQAQRLAGNGVTGTLSIASLFLLSGLLTAFCQLRLTAWCRTRLDTARSLTLGVLLLGLAFLPLALPIGTAASVYGFVPLWGSTLLLALGSMLVFPIEMDAVVGLAGGRLVATHYGLYSTIVGLGIVVGNLFTGSVLTWAWSADQPAVPWLALALLGGLTSLGVYKSTRAMATRDAPTAADTAG